VPEEGVSDATGEAAPASRAGLLTVVREYGRLARLEGGGFSVVAIFGAFAAGAGTVSLALAALLFVVNLLFVLGGCIHNDVVDAAIDRRFDKLGDRPIVRGTIRRSHAFAAALVCLGGCLAVAGRITSRPLDLGLLVGGLLCVVLYNLFSKRLLGADVFFAGAAALLCAFGGLASLPAGHPEVLAHDRLWLVCGIVFVDHIFFNAVEGGLKDFETDHRVGAPTIAHFLYREFAGGRRTVLRAGLLGFKLASVGAAAVPFVLWQHPLWAWQGIALAVVGLGTVLFSWQLLAQSEPDRERSLRLTKLQEMCCRMLVPLMLARVTGVGWLTAFIVVPFAWFFLFNYLLHGELFENTKTR
jgi:4-hydroxybenzoate polyprenyltransferase